jgi:kinesin family protein 6/9
LIFYKAVLKLKKNQAKELAQNVNEIKRQIDDLKSSTKKASGDGSSIFNKDQIINQTDLQNINHLKECKDAYKKLYESLKPLRVEIEHCMKATDSSRQKLMTEFEQWYESLHAPNMKNSENRIGEVLDIGEKFDRLQMERMALEDPDSLPFYNAKKNSDRRFMKIVKKVPKIGLVSK